MLVVVCAKFWPHKVSTCPVFVCSHNHWRQLFEMLIAPSIIMQNSSKLHHHLRLLIVVISVVAFIILRHRKVSSRPVCFCSQQKGRYLFEMLISPSIILQNSSKIHDRLRLLIVVISVVAFIILRHRKVSSCPVCFCTQQKGRYPFEMLISPSIILKISSKIHCRLRLLIVVISVVYFWESDASFGEGDGRMVRSSTWSSVAAMVRFSDALTYSTYARDSPKMFIYASV